jgi:hypothetical protein
MFLKHRNVDINIDFFRKGLLELIFTIFLVVKQFFIDLLLQQLPPGAHVSDHGHSCDTGLFNAVKYLPTGAGFLERIYSSLI